MFRKTIREGVYLALLEERHAVELFGVVDRERDYLGRWLPWVATTTQVDDTLNFIRISLQQFASNDGLAAGMWCGSELVGVIGTHKIDWLNRKVEIGYWIASKFQGRGIVTEGCRSLMEHAFYAWKLNRVEIHCAAGNEKSCAIPKRLGFQYEGLLREGQLVKGRFLDTQVYAMLAREWEKLKR